MVLGGRGVVPAETQGRYLFECNQPNCFRRLTFKTLEQAQLEQTNHKCPWWGGETKVAWSVTQTLVQQMWEKLDLAFQPIAQGMGTEKDKARARAIAECIAIFMPPFFTTADDVVREAVRRHKADEAGEDYETPGLGSRRYEGAMRQAEQHASATEGWYSTPDGAYTSDQSRAGAKATRATGRARTHAAGQVDTSKLTDAEKKTIKDFNQQMPQVFTAKALAKQYGVTEAVIEAVLSA